MSIRKLFFLSLLIVTTGCSSDLFLVHNGNMPSPEKISQLHAGQNRNEVEQLLGAPSSTTLFGEENWIYMSSTLKKVAFFKPEEINREILEVKFNSDGKVSQIMTYNKEDGKKLDIDTEETSADGHEIGFFRKYFGGVGMFMPIAPTDNNP